jgi:UPF0755 protein
MKRVFIPFLLVIIGLIMGGIWWINGNSPANSGDKKVYTFVVSRGEPVREIARRLKEEEFIKSSVVFFLLTNFVLDIDQKIQAGDHRISPSMTATEVARALTTATNDVWVTVVEGQRGDEIADTLKENIPSYEESWRAALNDNEGYLFPDTYLVPKDADIEQVIAIFRNNFDSKYATIDTSKTKFSKDEIVTIASLVEREAKHDEDRPLVASVITNRLRIGMKLDIDATVQYVLGYQEDEKDWWKKALTFADLEVRSPYNTYRVAGLPPTPIANPGLAALKAAVNPAKTDYLFYLSDKEGVNHYAETLDEHEANKEKYGL